MRGLVGGVLDDAATAAGIVALLLAAHSLTRLALPAAPLGLLLLAAVALAVRAFPLSGHERGFTVTSGTPILAAIVLYGTAWATVIAAAAVALHGATRLRRRVDPVRCARGVAHTALATLLSGLVCASLGATPVMTPVQSSPLSALPALYAAEVVLVLVSWGLGAPRHAAETAAPLADVARGSLFAAGPALASEPVLALVLALAAGSGSPIAALAATMPLAALIAALRLHVAMVRRLERSHAALDRANESLRVQATTDPLTSLPNRRLFEDTLDARLREAARYGRPLGVLLLDLDGFKRINDTYGHGAGDAVLVAVAGALRCALRRSDLPARLGGDEFVAVLPETDTARAWVLAQRVRAAIAALEIAVGEDVVRPTASIGAASTDGRSDLTPGSLLSAADADAYRAKAAGNGVACHAGMPAPARAT